MSTEPTRRRRGRGRRLAEAPHPPGPRPLPSAPEFTIITGLSGAGRSEAAKCLEDLGYFVVDNLPPGLIDKMVELVTQAGAPQRVAVVADARGGKFFGDLANALQVLRQRRVPTRILFLEASDEVLVNRFGETRRKHPLSPGLTREEGIRKERQVMEALRGEADLIIDTSEMRPHDLRERLREAFGRASPRDGLQVSVVSFGYKYGIPRDADLVLDVRFLPNPYWIDWLRALPGTEAPVKRYVSGQPAYTEFLSHLRGLLDFVIPGYVAEGKSYLTVAVGCTGGRHRSVVVADEVVAFFREKGLPVTVDHRDLDRE
jgi:RNase adapter protein RapZ